MNPSIEEEEEAQFSLAKTTISSLSDDFDYDNAPHSFSSNIIHTLNSTVTELAEIGGPFASLALILAVAFADSIPCIPSQPVAILSGAVFGFWKGILPFEIGQTLAIIFCMAVGRLVRKRKRNNDTSHYTRSDSKLSQILQELTVGLNSKDWGKVFCTIVIARQSPVLPFSLGNYFVGAATSAPLVPAVLGTVVGVFPGNVMLVGAGAGGVALIRSNGFVGTVLEIVGVISTIVLFYACYKAVRKVLCNGDSADKETGENIPLLQRPTSPQTSLSPIVQSDMTDDVATSA
jgi:uncharacterized membrane protein YdjX (TVP38/TMEM64 family)